MKVASSVPAPSVSGLSRASVLCCALLVGMGMESRSMGQETGSEPQLPPPLEPAGTEMLDVAALSPDGRARDFGLPTPDEFLGALAKETNPRWRTLYRAQLGHTLGDRSKAAVWLGARVAEIYLAAAARDTQQVRNLGKDLQAYGRILGIGEKIAPRLIRLDAVATAQDWNGVRFEIETLMREDAEFLRAQRDEDLAELCTIGLWIRLLEVGTAVVNSKDFPELALCVGGPGLVDRVAARFFRLSEATRGEAALSKPLRELEKIGRIWSVERVAAGHPYTDEDVLDSHNRLASSLEILTSK
jgi:hypothetical protein